MMRTIGFAMFVMLGAFQIARGQQTHGDLPSIENLIRSHAYDQALDATRSALRTAPKDSRLWTLEGVILSIKGSNQDALNAFARALEISPNDAAALRGEVQVLYQTQDKRAILLLQKILKADPRDATALEMLATLEEKQGDCKTAIDHFLSSEAAIKSHPGSLEAYSHCLELTGQPQKAIPVIEQLVALLPEETYPKFDLAVLLNETKQDEAALKVIEPLLAANESDPELLSLASEAYEAVGNTPKAVSLLRQAIVLNPSNANYYNSFALLCLDHESFQVGIDMLDVGIERIKDDPSLYISRGLLYAQLADFDKAEANFNSAERLDSVQSLSAYAADITEFQRALSDKSHPDKALLEIHSQLKAHPDSPLLHFLLAKLLLNDEADTDAKPSGEAVRSALLAVRLKPDLVAARDLLASIYTRSGQYNLAVEQCRAALQYSPTDQSAIYHLIVALRHSEKTGQRDEIPALVRRLSELQEASRQQLTSRKRFQLVEEQPLK
jgi:tetratricopeptide (TPR) repeat protein